MARHAAVPDFENDQWIPAEIAPVVEKHVSKAATEDDSEQCGSSDKIANGRCRDIAVASLCEMRENRPCRQKCQNVGETIPAHAKPIADTEKKRAEIVDVVS